VGEGFIVAPSLACGMMDRKPIFVSHSRTDVEGQAFLGHVYNLPGSVYRPVFYSVLGPVAPHAKSILEHLQGAAALVVLLSQDMAERDHTRAWVGFEVGIAAHRAIPVVVVEPVDGAPFNLPIPGVTHYIRRPKTADRISKTAWADIARQSYAPVEDEPWDATGETAGTRFMAWLYNLSLTTRSVGGRFTIFSCTNGECRARYFVENVLLNDVFHCPSCRRETMTPMVGIQRDLVKLAESASAAQGEGKGRRD
jgi:hypothetical protein